LLPHFEATDLDDDFFIPHSPCLQTIC
jgi:hypothetical protein